MKNAIGLILLGLTMNFNASLAAQEPAPITQVDDVIVYVRDSIPPELVVIARGKTDLNGVIQLKRNGQKTPPADGILEYEMSVRSVDATTGAVTPSAIQVSDHWDAVASQARWIKGVRILGQGAGIRQAMLGKEDLNRIASCRQFSGVSESGSLDEALQSALAKMNAASADGNVADGMITWHVGPVSGRVGGIAGFNELQVDIYAIRSPPWQAAPDTRRR